MNCLTNPGRKINSDINSNNPVFKEARIFFYKHADSYRPLSLTSCLRKLLEKIVERRLNAFAEHNEIIEQEGFRKFR